MSAEDQEKLGWNEPKDISAQVPYVKQLRDPRFAWQPGRFITWNNFINEVFDEMCARYGKDIPVYFVDGEWLRVDRERLKKTVWKYNPKAEFPEHRYDNSGWDNSPNQGCPWPSFKGTPNVIQGGSWWSTGGGAKVSPVDMHRYTVLQAGCNTKGGGVGWGADPYTDGTWEPNVREYFVMLGQLIRPIEESIKNTYSSSSYITPNGSRIATLPYGLVATRSIDDRYEYIHVLRPPTAIDERKTERYVRYLQLPPPADSKKFTKAVLLRSGREAKLTFNEKGVYIDVPPQDCWDPIDTVIKLTVDPSWEPQPARNTVTR